MTKQISSSGRVPPLRTSARFGEAGTLAAPPCLGKRKGGALDPPWLTRWQP
jgi:hypothetical protein